jgi:hypothetical protein
VSDGGIVGIRRICSARQQTAGEKQQACAKQGAAHPAIRSRNLGHDDSSVLSGPGVEWISFS